MKRFWGWLGASLASASILLGLEIGQPGRNTSIDSQKSFFAKSWKKKVLYLEHGRNILSSPILAMDGLGHYSHSSHSSHYSHSSHRSHYSHSSHYSYY